MNFLKTGIHLQITEGLLKEFPENLKTHSTRFLEGTPERIPKTVKERLEKLQKKTLGGSSGGTA